MDLTEEQAWQALREGRVARRRPPRKDSALVTLAQLGLRTVAGPGAGNNVVLLDKSKILLADDGIARIDSATQATLDMTNGSGSTPDFSLWMRNCVALRAEQAINWSVGPAAVQYVSGANYLGTGSPA